MTGCRNTRGTMLTVNDKLNSFLDEKIAQMERMDALADTVLRAERLTDIGDAYRRLIDDVKAAYVDARGTERRYTKAIREGPSLEKDLRFPWFNLVLGTLHKASSHSRPPVNSRSFGDIHTAAYVMHADISHCLYQLKDRRFNPVSGGRPREVNP